MTKKAIVSGKNKFCPWALVDGNKGWPEVHVLWQSMFSAGKTGSAHSGF